MKQGKTDLVALATEIQRQSASKADFIADTPAIDMVVPEGDEGDFSRLLQQPVGERDTDITIPDVALSWGNGDRTVMPVRQIAHRQLASRYKVPAQHYDRLLATHPDLLAHTMTGLMHREPQKRMLRTLDSNVRAFLSDKYRPLDNDELAEALLPLLHELGVVVVSCEITDRRLYVKFLAMNAFVDAPDLLPPNRQRREFGNAVMQSGAFKDIPAHRIIAGGVVSNSEVGQGTIRVDLLRLLPRCLNGWVDTTIARKAHVGASTFAEGVVGEQFFKDSTRQLRDAATFSELRDTVEGMFTTEALEEWVGQARQARQDTVPAVIAPQVVQVVGNRLALTDGHRKGVLESLIEDGDLSRWGVSNAITAVSHDVDDYDTATDLEAEGGKVVRMKKNDWSGIVQEAQRLYDAQ